MGNEDPEKKFDEARRSELSGSEEGEAPAQMSGTSIDFRPGYGLGLSLARLLEIIGWAVLVVAGVATVVLIVQMPNRMAGMALLVGAGAAFSGLILVTVGQVARAVFDTANTNREILAILKAVTRASVDSS